MANLQGRRVRATSAGIFGLGFKDKMKSVAAAGAILALATTGTVVVQSQLTPAVALANSLQEQDAIESPGPHNGRHTVNGHVYLDQEGTNSSKDVTDVGLQGVTVYAQWMDERIKGYAISPIYSTTTRVDGSYSVSLPTWTDEVGIDHEFKANAYQKLRVWIDNPDPQRFQVSFMESDGVFGDSIQRYRSTWGIATRRVNEQNIALTERKQDWLAKPESEWAESGAKAAGGYITGRVFWDQRNAVGAGDVPQFAKGHGDIGVAGQKVAASYLNDDVSWQIHDWKISRNFNFTPQEMQQAQKDIIAKWEAENPGKSAIAETVYSYTD